MRLYKQQGYKPAILKKGVRYGKPHYFLEYWVTNPNGEWKRIKESYGVNSQLKSLADREKKLQEIQLIINKKLPHGFPFKKVNDKVNQKKNINIIDGIRFALKLKITNSKGQSPRTYNSKANIFIRWLRDQELDQINARKYKTRNAVDFMNFLLLKNKGVNERTYNNYLTFIKGFFTLLIQNDIVNKNPFQKINRKKPKAKKRKPYQANDRKIIAKYCQDNFPILFLAIILIYYCFLRPDELRKLRIVDLDLDNNVIYTRGNFGKNSKEQPITIPQAAIPFIRSAPIWGFPNHYLIFGKGIKPHAKIKCGERSMNSKHRESVLDKLIKNNLLHSREGLSLYSWKDTGAQALVKKKVNIREIQKQLRHSSLDVTEQYLSSLHSVNKEILILENEIL